MDTPMPVPYLHHHIDEISSIIRAPWLVGLVEVYVEDPTCEQLVTEHNIMHLGFVELTTGRPWMGGDVQKTRELRRDAPALQHQLGGVAGRGLPDEVQNKWQASTIR
jgi:hypothetical protein